MENVYLIFIEVNKILSINRINKILKYISNFCEFIYCSILEIIKFAEK